MISQIKNKIVPKNEKLYHVGISTKDINCAEIAILPGDPGRVQFLAELLDKNATKIKNNREYTSYLTTVNNQSVLIMSTGMGCPSVAIAVEELAMLGVKKFIRVGTTGAIQEKIELGDLILNSAAVRLEGTSSHYAPLEYPAVADFATTYLLKKSADELNIDLHIGIGISSDTFWPGQERYDGYRGFVLKKFKNSLKEWQSLGLLNFEMEASALFTICSVFGLQAACICCTIAKRTKSESVDKTKYNIGMEKIMKIIQNSISNGR